MKEVENSDMVDIEPKQIIEMIMDILEVSYGNLGYLSFRLHSINPNTDEDVYIIKYSFIPRSPENKRIYYAGKVNIKNKNMFKIKEIKEEDLQKDDY